MKTEKWSLKNINLIGLCTVAFIFSFKAISDLDIWWHLAAGRHMIETGQFISTDPFSFTFQGKPWVSITWGYEVLVYLSYLLGGGQFFFVTLLHSVLAVFSIYFAYKCFNVLNKQRSQSSTIVGTISFLIALFFIQERWMHRPEIFSHFCGAVILYLLTSKKKLWLIPLIQLLWVNTHGIYLAGPAMVGLFWFSSVASREKIFESPLAKIFPVTLLVCILNPVFHKAYLWPFHLLNVLNHPLYQRSIPEATNPFLDGIWGANAWTIIFSGALIVFMMAASLFKTSFSTSKKHGLGILVLSIILIKLSISARRNIALMLIWMIPYFADFICQFYEYANTKLKLAKLNSKILSAGTLCMYLLVAFLGVTNLCRPDLGNLRFGYEPSQFNYPDGAIQYFKDHKLEGRVFSNVELADYFLFNLPNFQSYIDGRFAELYSVEHFQKYMDIQAHPFLLEEEAKKWGISHIALGAHNPLAKNMIYYFAQNPNWKLGYFDESSVVFSRRSNWVEVVQWQKMSENALQRIKDKQASSPFNFRSFEDKATPYYLLSEISTLFNHSDLARASLEKVFSIKALPAAWSLSCLLSFIDLESKQNNKGDIQKYIPYVEDSCKHAVKVSNDIRSWHTLGLLYLNTARTAQAIDAFQVVIQREPASYEGYLMLGRAYASTGNTQFISKMKQAFERAGRLRPYNNEAWVQLGSLFSQIGDLQTALSYFIHAKEIQSDSQIEKVIIDLQEKLATEKQK